MNQYSLSQLRDISDQLNLLAGILQTKPFYLRAKQIRQADKALVMLDASMTQELAGEAKQWKDAEEGLKVLEKKCDLIEKKQNEILLLEQESEKLRSQTRSWSTLEDAEREKIIQIASRTEEYLKNRGDKNETIVIHRYNRYSALKELLPYADNANYLCEALFHHENKEKYQKNIVKLEERIEVLNKQSKSVWRGFWVALVLCVFIATIPICFPLAISLWKRRQSIESQIVTLEETHRRENKRLLLSEDGLTASQEIRKTLGQVSIDQIRDTLMEVRDLKNEFNSTDRFSSVSAVILNFIDTHAQRLVLLFGQVPEKPLDMFHWLVKNVNEMRNAIKKLHTLQEQRSDSILQQKQMTKGYSKTTLLDSISKLQEISHSKMFFPFSEESKLFFCDVCIELPTVLGQMRETLFYVSKNCSVELNYWAYLKSKIQSFSNILSLCILDSELSNSLKEESSDEIPESESLEPTQMEALS